LKDQQKQQNEITLRHWNCRGGWSVFSRGTEDRPSWC